MRSIPCRVLLAAALVASVVTPVAAAQADCVQPTSQQLIVYHAGSLSAAFTPVEQAFTCQTGVASADYVDIDRFLNPVGAATFDILLARGRMVLAYSAADVGPGGKNLPPIVDPAAPAFNPPGSVPTVVDSWYQALIAPGVVVGGSHPFLDPSGYRSHLMFQLAQTHYAVPNLYDTLLQHYFVIPASANVLGKQYDFQFTYDHSARAPAQANPDYRYAYLPDDIDLSIPAKNDAYQQALVTMPGLGVPGADASVDVPATRVVWGLTIMKSAPDPENAVKFLQLLLSPGDIGQTTLQKVGPSPISPGVVAADDLEQVPPELRVLVTTGDPLGT